MGSRVLYSMSRDGLGIPVAARVERARRAIRVDRRDGARRRRLPGHRHVRDDHRDRGLLLRRQLYDVVPRPDSRSACASRSARARIGRSAIRGRRRSCCSGSLAFLVSAVVADRRNSLFALGILVVSYPVFRLTRPRPTTLVPGE